MADYMAFGEKACAAGVIVHGEALQPVATATTVHVARGKGGEGHRLGCADSRCLDGPSRGTSDRRLHHDGLVR
jgi:hypothetical protein